MQYQGSKNKLSKHIVPILQKIIDENKISNYIEPFVGGANMIDKIKCDCRIGYDNNKYLIELLKYNRDNNIDIETISYEEYYKVKESYKNEDKKYDDWYVGLVGFCGSFGAKWWGGYARRNPKGDKVYDVPSEAIKSVTKQKDSLKDISFECKDYQSIEIPSNSLIYCDPPYENTTKYGNNTFNHEEFWQWVREVSKTNTVIVSEYNAPNDFKCIWEKEHKTSLDVGSQKVRVEKMFMYDGVL